MGRRRGKLLSSTDPDYESRIQAALVDVTNGACKNISVAARVHKNLPLEHPATSSSSQALPPHFTHPQSHTSLSIPAPHPPYFFGQHTHPASHGLHNPSMYQYLPVHPHTFHQHYFTQQ
ncbi:hypothetical protein BDR04DRAFT_8523 [Suillus decipiens]|nr:hypothetical protein BDR04DRAFT_8523 [Suillus decipiens]